MYKTHLYMRHILHEMQYLKFLDPIKLCLAPGSLNLQLPFLGTNIPIFSFSKPSIIYTKKRNKQTSKQETRKAKNGLVFLPWP